MRIKAFIGFVCLGNAKEFLKGRLEREELA